MIVKLIKKVFGSRNDRLLKRYGSTVRAVNALESAMGVLSDEQLRAKTEEFRTRIQTRLAKAGESPDGDESDAVAKAAIERARDDLLAKALDEILPEAFAVVREAGKRVLGMRHFDVQLIGGMVLHDNKIAEMRTGEGKTLVATLPAYLNALAGRGVHVVTVNDYLAKRDADWMGQIYGFLGLTVGVNLSQIETEEKRAAYAADITYGTNNEFGFDYLRDNMEYAPTDRRQRPLHFAIVDEVDSILIDEARTPLIISGQAEDSAELYLRINEIAPKLLRQKDEESPGDFTVDEKLHQVLLSERGHEHAEDLMTQAGLLAEGSSLYDAHNITLMHHLYASLRAYNLFHRDQQYVVQNDEVIIVDEFTGRLMAGRRWSDGLHQAVEAKERVSIQKENQTLASITFQNYFRMYKKLAGMTGTADTEAYEFQQIYNLETVVIPTHHPMVREDRMDQVYRTSREKYQAVINDIKECQVKGQPVLVGTTSIENSELVSGLLDKEKLPHNVLNAKQHAREAEIIAQAGRPMMITIATNMAGRGTDIVLGGNPEPEIRRVMADDALDANAKKSRAEALRAEWQGLHDTVVAAGGLHIIATERHESRRVDNQLRGRSGRQGDPGSSRFYLSLEDPLLRIFASDRVGAIMQRLNMPDGEAIEHPWVTRAIENAQRKVEARNFDIRKQLLEYDDVANDQRKVIYQQRNELLESTSISDTIDAMRADLVHAMVRQYIPPESLEELWDVPGLENALFHELHISASIQDWLKSEPELADEALSQRIAEGATAAYQAKLQMVDREAMHQYERMIMLQSMDTHWREHLSALEHLRQGIHLRGYAQKNPKQEYKREAFELFSEMLELIKSEVTKHLMTVKVTKPEQPIPVEPVPSYENIQYQHADYTAAASTEPQAAPDWDASAAGETAVAEKLQPFVRPGQKVGRNDPCPCGSGKKYKQCHGRLS